MQSLMQPLDVATAASHATMAQPVGEKKLGETIEIWVKLSCEQSRVASASSAPPAYTLSLSIYIYISLSFSPPPSCVINTIFTFELIHDLIKSIKLAQVKMQLKQQPDSVCRGAWQVATSH